MLPYDKINNKMKSQPTKWEKNESHIFIWGHTIKIHFKNLKKKMPWETKQFNVQMGKENRFFPKKDLQMANTSMKMCSTWLNISTKQIKTTIIITDDIILQLLEWLSSKNQEISIDDDVDKRGQVNCWWGYNFCSHYGK